MKITFTLLLCVLWLWHWPQPNFSWVRETKSSANEAFHLVAAGVQNDVFVTGSFTGANTVVGTTTLTNTGAAGTAEFFVAKYNTTGQLLWVRQASGTGNDDALAIDVDAAGDVYVTGYFESPAITFAAGNSFTNSSSSGLSDIFIVHYDSQGNVVWAKAFGSTQNDFGQGVSVDGQGSVYVTGTYYSLSVLFGGYGVVNTGSSDAFVLKLNPAGTPLWAKTIGGGTDENGLAIANDNSGNVFVTGEFNSGTLSSFSPALVNAGGFDAFYAKYDATGNVLYSGRFGGTNNDRAVALMTDASGSFYLTGTYESTTMNVGTITLTNGSARDMFVARFNAGGSAQWAKRAPADNSSGPRGLSGGALNTELYLCGTFHAATIQFGTITVQNHGNSDGFVASYDRANGSVLWANSIGGPGFDRSLGISAYNDIFLTGSYENSFIVNGLPLSSAGNSDAFLAKLCTYPASPVAAGHPTLCPGVVGTLSVTGGPILWYNAATGGSTLAAGNNYTTQTAGTYFAAATNTAGCQNPVRTPVTLSYYTPLNPSVSLTGATLQASPAGSYQWYDCSLSAPITGATGSTYVITVTGNYAVIVTQNNCTDTSACAFYSVSPSGTVTPPPPPPPTPTITTALPESGFVSNDLVVYPNPSQGVFTLKASGSMDLWLTDACGRLVHRVRLDEGNQYTVTVSGLTPGIYFIVGKKTRIVVR